MGTILFLVLGLSSIAILLCVCSIREQNRRIAFELRFPPISDAEFLALCAPGTKPHIALRVRRIVADHLGVDYSRVYPSSRFVEDLGAD